MKKVCFVFITIFLIGCGSNKNISHNWGGFNSDFENGMTFYHQYEIIQEIKTKKGIAIVTNPFLTDLNENISDNTKSVRVRLFVKNPYLIKYTVNSKYELVSLETDKIILKSQNFISKSKLLPQELISVELPLSFTNTTNMKSQVIFSLIVFSENGKVLYRTSSAYYKIGS